MEQVTQNTSHPGSILLVDDDNNLREVISILLKDEGYEVLQAENGLMALELLKDLPKDRYPECMILDLMMPVMSGQEFLEVMEKEHREDLGRIPVIICSAEGKLRNHDQIVAKLEKPVNFEILAGAIRGCSEMLH